MHFLILIFQGSIFFVLGMVIFVQTRLAKHVYDGYGQLGSLFIQLVCDLFLKPFIKTMKKISDIKQIICTKLRTLSQNVISCKWINISKCEWNLCHLKDGIIVQLPKYIWFPQVRNTINIHNQCHNFNLAFSFLQFELSISSLIPLPINKMWLTFFLLAKQFTKEISHH